MLGLTALLFAAGMLTGQPSSFSAERAVAMDDSHAPAAIETGGETAVDDFAKDFDPYVVVASRSAMTLAVNGRVVATGDEPGSATAKEWNWSLLLLGCAGLVMTNLARRPVRRISLSS